MPPNANDGLLVRICGQEDTLTEARKLLPIAITRTKPGSGHDLGTLTTGLPAICAYIASSRLNNGDVSLDNARQASCLRPSDFTKALRTVSAALEKELSPRRGRQTLNYDVLHEKYSVEMPFSSFTTFLRQAEHALVQLGTSFKVESVEVRCSIFFWASSTIKVKQLPTLDEFAQDNALLSKRLVPIVKLLGDKCGALENKLVQAARPPSRSTSRTKAPQGVNSRTPRRSPTKALRELPTRDSLKRQQKATEDGSATQTGVDTADVEMETPETPTKKRRLATAAPSSSQIKKSSLTQRPFPPVTPSTSQVAQLASPTKSKTGNTPGTSSPLHRSAKLVLQEEVDDDVGMDVDESGDVDGRFKAQPVENGEDAIPLATTRRFRPVYQDLRQWHSYDARVVRMWKEAEQLRRTRKEALA